MSAVGGQLRRLGLSQERFWVETEIGAIVSSWLLAVKNLQRYEEGDDSPFLADNVTGHLTAVKDTLKDLGKRVRELERRL